ncbi:MAG TPA: hypothetical protein VK612_09820, partial [Pyrinomonadaceae bacterium]|nr:hypothetical protein [Pyrinomonadaceae bacterium]
MFKLTRALSILAFSGLFFASLFAQVKDREIEKPKDYATPVLERSPELQTILSGAINDLLKRDPSFKPEQVTATLIDLRDASKLKIADVRGENKIYPASVVKMFYMAALERQLADKKITLTAEMTRGMMDMIVDSSNEATQYILDVLTDTSSGAELPQKEFEAWQNKRNRVNRFYTSLAYTNINVNQKTFCEDAYGIEQQSRNYQGQNRNMLTTNATARLLAEIALRRFVSETRSNMMLDLMKRDWSKPSTDTDNQ